ncbi:MAG TPA: DUF2889 domain-containing protein, partial [Acidimicrobiia bacterium]|nr:DUF2889 domain-containing protein [Acidimicrobiia bacterium]
TTTIDTTRTEGLPGPMVMHGAARDLVTGADGTAGELAAADLLARVEGESHRLLELTTRPDLPAAQALLGAVVGPGFRRRAVDAAPGEAAAGTLLNLVLDDLPGAALVSGFALLAADAVPQRHAADEYLDARGDLCAGWAVEATMMTIIREERQSPVSIGPLAPALLREDDPDAWHPLPPLPPHSTRRLRRLDVAAPERPGAPAAVDVFFRDSHFDEHAVERIIHEYSVRATVDPVSLTIVDIDARADVLPWKECPGAVASAARLAGRPTAGLRGYVRETFVGTSTCTHLNDVLRGLADVGPLLAALA